MFYENIKIMCKQNKTSITKLCSEIGLSSGVLSKWKSGSIPNGETLIKIADYLNCSVDFILGRTETSRLVKDIPDQVIDILIEQYLRKGNIE